MSFPRHAVPQLGYVTQRLPSDHIADPRAETYQRLVQSGLLKPLNKRDKVAITAGSRGNPSSVDLLRGIIDAVRHFGGGKTTGTSARLGFTISIGRSDRW